VTSAAVPDARPGPPVFRLAEIAAALQAELDGDGDLPIHRIAPLDTAGPGALSFLAGASFLKALAGTAASAVLVAPAMREAAAHVPARLIVPQPYLAFARATQWWAQRTRPAPVAGVGAGTVVAASARIDPSAAIGPLCHIADGAVIGAGVVLGAQCVVGVGSTIGEGSRLHPRVTVGDGCHLGRRVVIQSGAVIGGDGFGFAPADGTWVKIEQLGGVRLGDDVEVGANTCIDRGALDDTVLEDGVKLDNLIQVAHNVRIGAHTAIAGCTGIAGSTRIGRHCMIGGAASIIGHLEIADHVQISAGTVVTRSIRQAGVYSGAFPFDDNASWEKNAATLRNLHAMRERLRALEKKTS
jgi:UDP-3-O-[3-hydroxymyristoyl] glucosamine N-acyltransferase